MRQNPHVRICGGPGSATTLVYPTSRIPQQLPITVEACALSVRKRFQQPVGDTAHLSDRVVDHAVPFGPGRKTNGNV